MICILKVQLPWGGAPPDLQVLFIWRSGSNSLSGIGFGWGLKCIQDYVNIRTTLIFQCWHARNLGYLYTGASLPLYDAF